MRKDKQIVLNKIKNEDTSKLHFVDVNHWGNVEEDQGSVKFDVRKLKRISSVEERVEQILRMNSEYASYDENNEFQCRQDANRSALDIWRLYNNYFRPVSIFYIMRILYNIVTNEDYEVGTMFCNDIRKQVFWYDSCEMEDIFYVNELGVRFAEWRTIGL